MSFSLITLSPLGRVGPLAASTIISALIFLASSSSMTFSKAAGIARSQSTVRTSAEPISSDPGYFSTLPVSFLCSMTFLGSRPSGL